MSQFSFNRLRLVSGFEMFKNLPASFRRNGQQQLQSEPPFPPLPTVPLPDLCMRRIFNCFGLRDLARCRAVCRLFRFYADQTIVHELTIDAPSELKYSQKWYLTERPINLKDQISWREFANLKPSQFCLEQHLKFLYLFVKSDDWTVDDLKEYESFNLMEVSSPLNRLKGLVHLEIEWWPNSGLSKLALSLPHLRVLSVRNFHAPLVLNTPQLETLHCDDLQVCLKVKESEWSDSTDSPVPVVMLHFLWESLWMSKWKLAIKHPERIKQLACDCYLASFFMAKFRGVEVFRCRDIAEPGLDPDLLPAWPHLRELDFDFSNWIERKKYEKLRSSLTHIMNQWATLKSGEELKVFLNDIRILDISQLKDYDFMKNLAKFRLKNYPMLRLATCPDVNQVSYRDLFRWHPQLSDDFFEKFPSIRTVEVTEVVDRDHFECFLKKANDLGKLILTDTSLVPLQTFLNSLPNITPQLTDLEVNESRPLRFDFILNFQCLARFRADQPFDRPLDLAEKMFEKFEYFYQFDFRSSFDQRVVIQKQARFKVILYEIRTTEKMFQQDGLEWHELVDLCDQMA